MIDAEGMTLPRIGCRSCSCSCSQSALSRSFAAPIVPFHCLSLFGAPLPPSPFTTWLARSSSLLQLTVLAFLWKTCDQSQLSAKPSSPVIRHPTYGLGLTTVTALLSVVSSLSLGNDRVLSLLVLGDLVRGVLSALLALAVGSSGLGNVDPISSNGIISKTSTRAEKQSHSNHGQRSDPFPNPPSESSGKRSVVRTSC